MEKPSTRSIVEALTRAIVEHRLLPGSKLVEQALADEFGVSRTLVRQALFQLSQNRLVRMQPARGAFVAAPSADEARQVFAVRRMLEAGMTRAFAETANAQQLKALQAHIAQEAQALRSGDVGARAQLLGEFHVSMARLLGQDVLAQLLQDLIRRCALSTLIHQSERAAAASHAEHRAIVQALRAHDAAHAMALMDEHLGHVEHSLQAAPANAMPPTTKPSASKRPNARISAARPRAGVQA